VRSDERHRGPAVEQLDRRADLLLAHPQFLGDPALNSGVGGRLRVGGSGGGHEGSLLSQMGTRTIS
jgi:hypothetical protein